MCRVSIDLQASAKLALNVPTMRFDVLTLFPEALSASLDFGVLGRARARQIVDINLYNPRDFAYDAYKRVDERVYGGGPGMVLMLEPLKRALADVKSQSDRPAKVIFLSPQGPTLTQEKVHRLTSLDRIILICGRYEGLDERFIEHYVDEELSIGDYVLSGGEPAALVLIDAITRLLPGVLNKSESAEQDSFEHGLLDCPHFTRPEIAPEGRVPAVLKSGDHAAIARWRLQQSLGRTYLRRPDLLTKRILTKIEKRLLAEFLEAQQVDSQAPNLQNNQPAP